MFVLESITAFIFANIWGAASTDKYSAFSLLFSEVPTGSRAYLSLRSLILRLLAGYLKTKLPCVPSLFSPLDSAANSTILRGFPWGSRAIAEAKGWPRGCKEATCQLRSVTPAPQICFDWTLLAQTSSNREDIRVWGGSHTSHIPAPPPLSCHVYWSPQCGWLPGCCLCVVDCHVRLGIPSVLLDHRAPWKLVNALDPYLRQKNTELFITMYMQCGCHRHSMWSPSSELR